MKLKNRYSLLLTTLITLFSYDLKNSSFAVEQNDFNLISTKYNNMVEFRDNYLRLKTILETVNEKVKYHEKNTKNTNYKEARKNLEEAKRFLEEADVAYTIGESTISRDSFEKALGKLRDSQLNLMPSRVAEARGMYLDADSIPRNKKDITELVKMLKNANFNVIYPEVFRRGYTIFSNQITETDALFKEVDFDVLSYLVEEAHHFGLEVHPWIWTFRVKSPTYGDPILSRYTNLTAIKEYPLPTDREPLFLSPSAPQARELIAKLLKFLASNYEIDGLLLDYIRYDETINEDVLSKKYFRLYYLEKYGKEPPWNIPRNEPIFTEWQLWRENQVTTAVELIKKEVNSVKPNIPIGAAVFRTEGEGRLLKMQDWRLWDSNLLIKYICPMLYTDNPQDLTEWLNSETDKESRIDYLYVSLGAHKFATPDDIYSQIGILQKRYVTGFNIFAMTHFKKETFKDALKGVFRKPAVLPHTNPLKAVKLLLSDTTTWLNEVNKDFEKEKKEKLGLVIAKINKINNSITLQDKNTDYVKVKNDLEDLTTFIKNFDPFNQFYSAFLNDISDNIEYPLKIMRIYTREEQSRGKKFASSLPPIPILDETKPLPYAPVIYTNMPPIIDGMTEYSIWERIEPLRNFYWHMGYSKPEVETVVKLSYDDDNLYILFENYEPNMKNTKSNELEKDDWQIFNEDSIEVLLQIPGKSRYYRFVANKSDSQFDESQGNVSWHADWLSAVKVEDQKWTVELEIPFSEINFKPKKDGTLKANFVRNRPQEINPFSHWSPTYGGSNNTSRFGTIILK